MDRATRLIARNLQLASSAVTLVLNTQSSSNTIKEQFGPNTNCLQVILYKRNIRWSWTKLCRNMQTSKTIWSELFHKEKAQTIHKDLYWTHQILQQWHLTLLGVVALVVSNITTISRVSAVRWSYKYRWESSERISSHETESGYTMVGISDGDETGIYYECIPQRASISKAEKNGWVKAIKDLITLVFSINA